MNRKIFLLVMLLMMTVGQAQANDQTGALCPVTLGANEVLGPPFPESESWYGSESLAVMVPGSRPWGVTGPRAAIAVKLFWWSAGFKPGMESNLTVSVRNLFGEPNDAVVSQPTNAHAGSRGGWAAMLTGIDFPSAGCWEITGNYLGQTLTFVVETVDRSDDGGDAR